MLYYHESLSHQGSIGWVSLRELTGEDENSVEENSTLAAIRLLDRLLTTESGTALDPGDARKLIPADRDRLLVSVYKHTYGSRIESTRDCPNCGEPFDLDFSLNALQSSLTQTLNKVAFETDGDGVFSLTDGCRFRLPTGEDELAVSGLSPEKAGYALLERCILDETPPKNPDAIESAMQELAPIMDLEIELVCPECEHEHLVNFNIQSYLLTAIKQERNQFLHEVHRLASSYGWSLSEILGLPRSRRRVLAFLIESELMGGS